jgi:hypothetical protein
VIYLGTAYSHPDPAVRKERFDLALEAAAILARAKVPCYVPIAAWHVVAIVHKLPGDHEFWRIQDEAMLHLCDEGWFVWSDGLNESKGVKAELELLKALGKPKKLFDSLTSLAAYARSYSRV